MPEKVNVRSGTRFIYWDNLTVCMDTSIEDLHEDIVGIKKDLEFIKNVLSENYELSDYAKKALHKARNTPESEYVDLE